MSRIDAEVVKRGKEAANPDPVEKYDLSFRSFLVWSMYASSVGIPEYCCVYMYCS